METPLWVLCFSFAFKKKDQPDRCQTWLFFSHWKTLILEPLSMLCSVKTSPICLKLAEKVNIIFLNVREKTEQLFIASS
jgi:hypothetical protein